MIYIVGYINLAILICHKEHIHIAIIGITDIIINIQPYSCLHWIAI